MVSPTLARADGVVYGVTDDEMLQGIMLRSGKVLKPQFLRNWAKYGYITPPRGGRGRGNKRNWPGESLWEAVAGILLTTGRRDIIRTADLKAARAIGLQLLGQEPGDSESQELYSLWLVLAEYHRWRAERDSPPQERLQAEHLFGFATRKGNLPRVTETVPLWWVAIRESHRLGLWGKSAIPAGGPPKGNLWLALAYHLDPLRLEKPKVARSWHALGIAHAPEDMRTVLEWPREEEQNGLSIFTVIHPADAATDGFWRLGSAMLRFD